MIRLICLLIGHEGEPCKRCEPSQDDYALV
jgi:hypothetical protein